METDTDKNIQPSTSTDYTIGTSHAYGVLDIEKELTSKFLKGELSFTEYSTEWYGHVEDEEEIDVDEDLDQVEIPKKPLERSRTKRRKFTRLSPALLGLMGEANIRFVRGEKEVAEKMCREIIRQVPTASEPYQTLAQIYENDADKSLQFSLLAAHLSPSDADEWLRLAGISKQRNDVRQEMLCYTQAIKANPQQMTIHMKRLELLESLEENGYPINSLKITRQKCYHKIVTSMPKSDGETIMKFAKMAASIYHSGDEIEKAYEVMQVAYEKCSELFNFEDVNLYLELLISQQLFEKCIDVFIANVGVEIEAELQFSSEGNQIEEQTQYLGCKISNDLPIDLRAKLLICLANLGASHLVENQLDEFLINDVETTGDLYMDIGETFMLKGDYNLALKLLQPLVNSKNYNLGAVWLKHAECLQNLGKDDDAIQSYKMVLKHAPQHADARRRLFAVLEKQGNYDEALEALQQDYTLVVSPSILYEQCCFLRQCNRPLKFLEIGLILLSKTFVKFRHLDELKIARAVRSTPELIYNFRIARGENPHYNDDIQFEEDETFKLSPAEEWQMFLELFNIAYDHKKYYIMERLSFAALMSKNLISHRLDIEFLCVQASLLNKHYGNAFPFARDFIFKFFTLPKVWNLLNLLLYTPEDRSNNKFLLRLFQKERSISLRKLFLGNNYLASGRYLAALKYFLEYHEEKKEPLTALLIGITLLVMAAQKTVDKHHNLILLGISYLLSYKNMRKWDQESLYNIGRAYQMLSLNNLAIEYYERALKCTASVDCAYHGSIDLTKETAFNLYLLYKDSSPQLARMYLQKYIVV